MFNIEKPVKFINPQNEEESKSIYRITNYNEVTKRCYIINVNSELNIIPEELVLASDLINI